jgi:hypothetical protein
VTCAQVGGNDGRCTAEQERRPCSLSARERKRREGGRKERSEADRWALGNNEIFLKKGESPNLNSNPNLN